MEFLLQEDQLGLLGVEDQLGLLKVEVQGRGLEGKEVLVSKERLLLKLLQII
jgi:hypothetical protein